MHPFLDSSHAALQAAVRDFALESVAPVARELDEECRFPWDNVRAMGERGWLGVPVPKELGGMGRDYLSYVLVVEELAKHDASHAITVAAHTTLGTAPLVAFGSEEQKRRFVPFLASGQVLGGFGADRAPGGIGLVGRPHARGGGERRLQDRRRQDIHHPRGGGRSIRRRRLDRPVQGCARDHQLRGVQAHDRVGGGGARGDRPSAGASVHARRDGWQEGGQARMAGVGHAGVAVRRGVGGRGPAALAKKGRASPTSCAPWTPAE